jgi:hypothetical protein
VDKRVLGFCPLPFFNKFTYSKNKFKKKKKKKVSLVASNIIVIHGGLGWYGSAYGEVGPNLGLIQYPPYVL